MQFVYHCGHIVHLQPFPRSEKEFSKLWKNRTTLLVIVMVDSAKVYYFTLISCLFRRKYVILQRIANTTCFFTNDEEDTLLYIHDGVTGYGDARLWCSSR